MGIEVRCEDSEWINLAQGIIQWRNSCEHDMERSVSVAGMEFINCQLFSQGLLLVE
jgi:hypothetical protein